MSRFLTRFKTTPNFRRYQREYREDLLHRVRLAPCPVCHAQANEPCRGRHIRSIKTTHGSRHDLAKVLGFVHGKAVERANLLEEIQLPIRSQR